MVERVLPAYQLFIRTWPCNGCERERCRLFPRSLAIKLIPRDYTFARPASDRFGVSPVDPPGKTQVSVLFGTRDRGEGGEGDKGGDKKSRSSGGTSSFCRRRLLP